MRHGWNKEKSRKGGINVGKIRIKNHRSRVCWNLEVGTYGMPNEITEANTTIELVFVIGWNLE